MIGRPRRGARAGRAVAALGLGLLAACGDKAPDLPPLPPKEFQSASAFPHIATQVAFGPRIPGSAGHRAQADWLEAQLRPLADTLIVQAWEHVTASGKRLPMRNFVARFQPQAATRLLFLAHWDTRPISDSPDWKGDKTLPVPGANDGASGVAVLLEVARLLKAAPPGVGVDLLFTDGEDYGDFQGAGQQDVLIGSRWYAQHLPEGPMPRWAVLLDMVGDADQQFFPEGNSMTGAPTVVEEVWSMAERLGLQTHFISTPKHTLIDDHVELQKIGIRAIDVVDFDYPYWHTPDDTPDKTSAESLQRVGDLVMALIRTAQP
jgi:hypothetical protein